MTFEQVLNDVGNIIEKYYNDEEEYYNKYRYGDKNELGDETEYNLCNELENYFSRNNIEFKIEEEDGFDSPSYSEDFMAIAFSVKDGHGYSRLGLKTVVFKYM